MKIIESDSRKKSKVAQKEHLVILKKKHNLIQKPSKN